MKAIRLITGILLCVVLCCSSMAVCLADTDSNQVLNVYNWGVYMDLGGNDGAYYDQKASMDVNAEFEKWYKDTYGETIRVNYVTYENNEAMYQKLVAGGANYDIVIPSDYMIARLIKEERLEKLDFSQIPNYQYIDDSFKGENWQYDPTHEYTVPYMWGYVGIVYNTQYVTGAVNTWDVLWDEAYKGKILMFNNARDAFAIALGKNGYSLNTTNTTHWQKAYEDLMAQKPLVQGYVTDEIFDKMQNGEAYIAPCYYGDYLTMNENAAEGVELAFGTVTAQPTNKYVDAMCIPKDCQNKMAALRYINFMCSYQAGVANANYTGYSSPLSTVAENKGELYYHYSCDPGVYPSDSILDGYEEYLYLGTATQAIMDNYWKDLKKSEGGIFMYIALGVVLVLAAGILIYRKAKQKRLAKLQEQARKEYDAKKKAKK
ncbi:MAG: ABC transporter substrate-binding protein [Clostridia bacterium]|nr:ABC transporter substrate-binding protein [Clostridia bacterium]